MEHGSSNLPTSTKNNGEEIQKILLQISLEIVVKYRVTSVKNYTITVNKLVRIQPSPQHNNK